MPLLALRIGRTRDIASSRLELEPSTKEGAMKAAAPNWCYALMLAVCASCGLGTDAKADPENKDVPKPLPPEIVKAWIDAGATAGWIRDIPPKIGRP